MSALEFERRVLFVCTHNAGRSIVAAALLNAHQPPGVRADSAGTDPTDALNPTVVTALGERGISLAGVAPKPITMVEQGHRTDGQFKVLRLTSDASFAAEFEADRDLTGDAAPKLVTGQVSLALGVTEPS